MASSKSSSGGGSKGGGGSKAGRVDQRQGPPKIAPKTPGGSSPSGGTGRGK